MAPEQRKQRVVSSVYKVPPMNRRRRAVTNMRVDGPAHQYAF